MAVTIRVSVKVGRCRLCCSQAAMGARMTVLSRSTSRSKGDVISWNLMQLLLRARHLLLMSENQLGILPGRALGVNLIPADWGEFMALRRLGAWQFCGGILVFASLAGGCSQED